MFKCLLIAILLALTVSAQAKEEKYLHYQYSKNVIVVISNISCPYKTMANEYKLAAVAYGSNGAKLTGCFKPLDADNIEIMWYDGDRTVIPANAFLKPKELEATL